ncbi:SGNH/GDSL hydrolase family protein [Motilibacter aurantiacus]|uniref:SGNH/GDSL hydrolase family protein n=1 Tax=Motilibacter aurantiacus TaxID=2714955 RepID=UPI00140C4382|nr:SGNH/GDSL hydrolase family protein [Motilibacter aurantiacus]NHC45250.1 SGNH/GDSL hydrolase family protein [Motilibacter aurantiacus]
MSSEHNEASPTPRSTASRRTVLRTALLGAGAVATVPLVAQPATAATGSGTAGATDTGAPPALRAARAALALRAVAPVRIVAIGSSTTAGNNAGTAEKRWLTLFSRQLHARLLVATGGVFTPGVNAGLLRESEWVFSGSTATVYAGLALATRLSAGASMTHTARRATAFTVLHGQGPGAGAFTVRIDGGAPVTVTPATSGVDRSDGSWTSGSLAPGQHTITITALGAVTVDGLYSHDGDVSAGIQAYNGGVGGATVATFLGKAPVAQRLAQLKPAIVLLMQGSNDYAGGVSIATFKAQLLQQVAEIKAAAGPVCIALVSMHQRGGVTSPLRWTDYTTAMAEVAATDPARLLFIDTHPVFASVDVAGADPLDLLSADQVHLNEPGLQLYADLLADVFCQPVAGIGTAAVPPVPPPPAPAAVDLDFTAMADTAVLPAPLVVNEASRPTVIRNGRLCTPTANFEGQGVHFELPGSGYGTLTVEFSNPSGVALGVPGSGDVSSLQHRGNHMWVFGSAPWPPRDSFALPSGGSAPTYAVRTFPPSSSRPNGYAEVSVGGAVVHTFVFANGGGLGARRTASVSIDSSAGAVTRIRFVPDGALA